MKATVKAYAKVNLSLDITGKRADGYHTLRSVMQSVSLCDVITVLLKNDASAKVSLVCSKDALSGPDNLAFKAAEKFLEASGVAACVEIHIEKDIPLAGGLGGGSVDAAAVLGVLNDLCDKPLSCSKLNEIALSLGADVPFCLKGGTCLAEGIGEQLTRLPYMPECNMLIAKKGVKNSTGEMYRILDETKSTKTSNFALIKEGLASGSIGTMCGGFYNCFETVCGSEPLLVRDIMLHNGALYAGLSGAGPSVFGIFETSAQLENAEQSLRFAGAEVFRCVPVEKGFEIV